MQKLAIGTVQFGIPYGISNDKNHVPSADEIGEVFDLAREVGIKFLDTAPAYGDSEFKIGKLSGNRFEIITKFSNTSSRKHLGIQLRASIKNLGINSIYGYLAHNANNLIDWPELWDELLEIKQNGLSKKIGFSLYDVAQLEKLLDLGFIPDMVQVPYSILDRKFERYFGQLNELGTEIHVRSIFLQGLYFLDLNKLPEKLEPLRYALSQIRELCSHENVSITSLALNFALSNKFIDQVVIGVNSISHLEENIRMMNNWKPNDKLFVKINEIQVSHQELLNPVNW